MSRPSGCRAHLPVDGGARPHQGPSSALVTLVEYGDYECPYCGAAYPIIKEVQARMGERLRFVFRNFPISTSHPHAEQAAEAAEAAAAQGPFWEMHDTLYENQSRLTDPDLHSYAEQLGLDVQVFDQELAEPCPRRARAGRLHERRSERRERHADVLRQRREIRRLVRSRDAAGRARASHEADLRRLGQPITERARPCGRAGSPLLSTHPHRRGESSSRTG